MKYLFKPFIFLLFILITATSCTSNLEDNSEKKDKYNYEQIRDDFEISIPFGVIEEESITIFVSNQSKNTKIYYTINGTPAEDLFFQNPDSENLLMYSENGIFLQKSDKPESFTLTPNVTFSYGLYSVGYMPKGVPLSLIEVSDVGEIISKKRGTYIFCETGASHFGSIPVVCLSASADSWIGEDLVSGVYNDVSNGMKIRALLEYFDLSENNVFSLNTQVKLGGAYSKRFACRTLNCNFRRDEHGIKNPAPDFRIFDRDSSVGSVRRFRLHSGGNDVFSSFFCDALIQRIVYLSDLNIGTSCYQPCVLYLNGEYWGIYGLREHYDKDYISYCFSVEPDDVIYVDKGAIENGDVSKYGFVVKDGDEDEAFASLNELYELLEYYENEDGSFIVNNEKDWTSSKVYDQFCKLIDIDSFIDLVLIEGYIGNFDFMGNNLRMWKTSKTNEKIKYYDGKWRFLLQDVDQGLIDIKGQNGLSVEAKAAGKNILDWYCGNCTRAYDGKNLSPKHYLLLSRPIQNEKFRKKLIDRATYISNVFAPDIAIDVLDKMEEEILHLYGERVFRWGYSKYDVAAWKRALENKRQFLLSRSEFYFENIEEAFGHK